MVAMNDSSARSRYLHPGWALLFAGVPLFMGFFRGPLFIDDAYITFRYAENLSLGRGFVYNSEPVLGTTAPFYCLLLAGARLLDVPMEWAAFFIGVLAGAIAPLICWRLGIAADKPGAGWLGALLLCLFPTWWLNSKTGMETTLAGSLAMAAIYLDLKERSVISGAVCGLLVLTRPDAACLPVLLFLFRFFDDRRRAMELAAAGALVLLPWAVFSWLYFGSPVPQSLPAKKLIHYFPWHLAGYRYLGWFVSARQPAGMFLMSLFWAVGAWEALKRQRRGMVIALWPPLLIAGLALTQVGPFYWYKIPALPAYFLIAAGGIAFLGEREWAGLSSSTVRSAAATLVSSFIGLQLISAFPYVYDGSRLSGYTEKEDIFRSMAQQIRDRSRKWGKDEREIGVYVGEIGVIGFELMDFDIIDSAGINSKQVYEIRKRDLERLKERDPDLSWKERWRGSEEWSREVIATFKPDFIASNSQYLHLMTLQNDPEFQARYELIHSWQDSKGNVFVLFGPKMSNAAIP
jgi:hypothetical protein